MTKQRPGESYTDFRARANAQKTDERRRAILRELGVPGNEPRKAGAKINPLALPQSVHRRRRRQMGVEQPRGPRPQKAIAQGEGQGRPEPAPVAIIPTHDHTQIPHPNRGMGIAGFIQQLIPEGPARAIANDWHKQGTLTGFYRRGGQWWLQAHDRHAPLTEFIETANRESGYGSEQKP